MAFLAPLLGGGWFAGTALASMASLGAFGTIALRLGASLLLSAASQALMPGPSLPARTVTVREAVAPRDMVYGRARKGGVIVYISESGSKRQYLHLVVVLRTGTVLKRHLTLRCMWQPWPKDARRHRCPSSTSVWL